MTHEARRVAGGRILHVAGALAQSVENAQAAWSSRAGIVIEIWDAAGQKGVGEASPLPGFSRETLADCARALEDFPRFELDWPPPQVPALATLPAARFAWECAVADLVARQRGVCVAALLGGAAHPRSIPLSALSSTGNGMLQEARAALARGARTLKVKIGRRDFSADLAALIALRAELGDGFRLRLDANGSFTIDEARERLAQLHAAQLAIEFVEQPVAPGSLAALGVCALPWAADESLQDVEEAAALQGAPGCAAWIIKPAALGLLAARARAMAAAAHGHAVVVTHLFDGPIGFAAACELALSLPKTLACGLDAHTGLSTWPVVALPHVRDAQAPEIFAHGRSGLGFEKAGLPWC